MGICPEYDDPGSDIRLCVRQTLALLVSFLPVEEVIDAFEELVENAPAELQDFFLYVEDYIGR